MSADADIFARLWRAALLRRCRPVAGGALPWLLLRSGCPACWPGRPSAPGMRLRLRASGRARLDRLARRRRARNGRQRALLRRCRHAAGAAAAPAPAGALDRGLDAPARAARAAPARGHGPVLAPAAGWRWRRWPGSWARSRQSLSRQAVPAVQAAKAAAVPELLVKRRRRPTPACAHERRAARPATCPRADGSSGA
jgi:hypothetical protein